MCKQVDALIKKYVVNSSNNLVNTILGLALDNKSISVVCGSAQHARRECRAVANVLHEMGTVVEVREYSIKVGKSSIKFLPDGRPVEGHSCDVCFDLVRIQQ